MNYKHCIKTIGPYQEFPEEEGVSYLYIPFPSNSSHFSLESVLLSLLQWECTYEENEQYYSICQEIASTISYQNAIKDYQEKNPEIANSGIQVIFMVEEVEPMSDYLYCTNAEVEEGVEQYGEVFRLYANNTYGADLDSFSEVYQGDFASKESFIRYMYQEMGESKDSPKYLETKTKRWIKYFDWDKFTEDMFNEQYWCEDIVNERGDVEGVYVFSRY